MGKVEGTFLNLTVWFSRLGWRIKAVEVAVGTSAGSTRSKRERFEQLVQRIARLARVGLDGASVDDLCPVDAQGTKFNRTLL